jgi:hypothetical protein
MRSATGKRATFDAFGPHGRFWGDLLKASWLYSPTRFRPTGPFAT